MLYLLNFSLCPVFKLVVRIDLPDWLTGISLAINWTLKNLELAQGPNQMPMQILDSGCWLWMLVLQLQKQVFPVACWGRWFQVN